MNSSRISLIATAALLVAMTTVHAENWAQFRGPHFNGSSDEKGLPAQWSKTENVAWSVDMPGPSASVPIVWGDYVLMPSGNKTEKTLMAFCLDRKTGKILWQEKVADGYNRDPQSNYASPSPATDGKQAFFMYGNGDLVAFDLAGKKLWSRNIQTDYGDFAYQWTYSASPLLLNGKLYIQVLQRDQPVHGKGKEGGESFLLALDPTTGSTLWRHVRPSDAVQESREAFTTPMPYEFQGRKELIIVGGDCLTGHDPETGKELWRWGTWNPNRITHWRLVPSAVAGDGIILASAPKKSPIYAIKAGGSGTLPDSAIAWQSDLEHRELSSDVPTPLFYHGDFFILGDDKRALSRVEPKTGKEKWTVTLPPGRKLEASPMGADGKVYIMDFAGTVTVVDAEKGVIMGQIQMGEQGDDKTRSSISASQGHLFIRTNSKLWCIGAGGGERKSAALIPLKRTAAPGLSPAPVLSF